MGQRHHNVVVINGKRYSVDTGELLSHKQEQAVHTDTAVKKLAPSVPTDLRRPPQHVSHHPHHTDLRKKAEVVTRTQTAHPTARHSADGITSRHPKSLKTHKPAASMHSRVKPAAVHHREKQPHVPKLSPISARHTPIKKPAVDLAKAPSIDLGNAHHEARRLRAAQHRKHEKISKFAAARRNTADQNDSQKAPTQTQAQHFDAVAPMHPKARASHAAMAEHQTVEERLVAESLSRHQAVAQHHPKHSKAHKHHQVHRAKAAEHVLRQTVIEAGPDEKQSLWQRFISGQKHATAIAVSLTVVVIVGYITYLNVPNVAMRVAASRAGFDATMPAYTPDGFRFDGPIAYNSGQVVIDFSSNTDKRNYSVAQKRSNWDSKSLLENKVKKETDNYLTFQDRGLTIYVYDGTKATWVNRGIWYSIEGDSKLNTEQLLKIAASL